MSDTDRAAALVSFVDDYGCGERDAALAARAAFPFDDVASPGRDFEHHVRTVSQRFGAEIRDHRGNSIGVAAERAIETYLELARDYRESYYVDLFERILSEAAGPAAAPEPAE